MTTNLAFFWGKRIVCVWMMMAWLSCFSAPLPAQEPEAESQQPEFIERYPPTYIYKYSPGRPFFDFDFPDLENRRWHCRDLRGKPVIILTAHRSLRHDLMKWALLLKDEFEMSGKIHLLWVVNLSRYPWDTDRTAAQEEWSKFAPPIPLILDWHSQVGRGLKITYEIPNIIGIDMLGNLAFHEKLPCTEKNAQYIAERIRRLLSFGFGTP